VLERARQGTADNVHRFLLAILGLSTNAAQALSCSRSWWWWSPWRSRAALLAAPYLAYQWRMARHLHARDLAHDQAALGEYFLSRAIGALGRQVRLLGPRPL
jgi:hypothetical protein